MLGDNYSDYEEQKKWNKRTRIKYNFYTLNKNPKYAEILLRLRYELINFFSMHPFSIPWKHQKTVRFSDVFRG